MSNGIYTMSEFVGRQTLKLAPDAFATIMSRTETRVIVPSQKTSNRVDFTTGTTSININSATQPGVGNCTITYVSPQYDSLDSNFYVEQPSGVRVPFFTSMMEVRVYGKGRYLSKEGLPVYYPVFWGFIQTVDENPTGNETTFTLNCRDMLGWWEYQYMNVVPAPVQGNFGGPEPSHGGSVFRFMNPWEVLLNLFSMTGFDNFVYPFFIGFDNIPPAFADYIKSDPGVGVRGAGGYEILAGAVLKDWKGRYGFGVERGEGNKWYVSNLEMFGVNGKLDMEKMFHVVDRDDAQGIYQARVDAINTTRQEYGATAIPIPKKDTRTGTEEEKAKADQNKKVTGCPVFLSKGGNDVIDRVSLEYDIMGAVLPYANFDEYNTGDEPVRMTKLEMAAKVSGDINFEFYQDTNGTFVFKPPFYNMDVSRNTIYTIKAPDILSFSQVEDSSQIVTMMQVTGNTIYTASTVLQSGVHIDFGLVEKYGMRERTMNLAFGNNPEVCRAMAASEMAKVNANAYTGSLTIPFRPEMRMGYPIYLDHIDAFYYVKGISHAITFGSSATTTLTLQAKRSRVFDSKGKAMRAYVYSAFSNKLDESSQEKSIKRQEVKNYFNNRNKNVIGNSEYLDENEEKAHYTTQQGYAGKPSPLTDYYIQQNLISSPNPGFYRVTQDPAFARMSEPSSDAGKKTDQYLKDGALLRVTRFTANSLPYTDVNGFQHIGAFPYGAMLVLAEDSTLKDSSTVYGSTSEGMAVAVLNIGPEEKQTTEVAVPQITTAEEEELVKQNKTSDAEVAKRVAEEISGASE